MYGGGGFLIGLVPHFFSGLVFWFDFLLGSEDLAEIEMVVVLI